MYLPDIRNKHVKVLEHVLLVLVHLSPLLHVLLAYTHSSLNATLCSFILDSQHLFARQSIITVSSLITYPFSEHWFVLCDSSLI